MLEGGLRVARPVESGGSSAVSSHPLGVGVGIGLGAPCCPADLAARQDESGPICNRCKTLNLPCDGPKEFTFIHAQPSGSGPVQKRTSLQLSESPAAPPLSASPRVVGVDVYIGYTRAHLQPKGLIVTAIEDINVIDLAAASTTAVASQHVSHQAIMSLATLHFGVQHRQSDIANQGYAMYGNALTQLNAALSDPTRQQDDGVIVAVAAMAIAEYLVPTGPNNYLAHICGLERLVDLQHPTAFWLGKSAGFCDGVRFMILHASLQLGKPCILARPEWKKAMRVDASHKKLQQQDVFDVLADCTVLLGERKAMSAASAADFNAVKAREQRGSIQHRASSLLMQLYGWRVRWDADLKEGPHDGPAKSLDIDYVQPRTLRSGESDGSLIPIAMIKSIPAAVTLMLYNLALLYVLQIHASPSLEPRPEGPSEMTGAAARGYHATEEIFAAREICRCIQYYLTVKSRLDATAPPIIHWAVGAAWKRLRRDDSAEGAWMRDLLTRRGRQVIIDGLWTTYKWINSLPE